jgi:signal transduction histidine kinase
MAVAAEILTEIAASTQAGRVLADNEQPAPSGPAGGTITGPQPSGQQSSGPQPSGQQSSGPRPSGGQSSGPQPSGHQLSQRQLVGQQLVGQQVSLAETLRAGAIFFEVTVDSLSGHAANDPTLLPGFVTFVSALNESVNKRIRRATAAYTRQLVEHIHRAQLDERRSIARELHDRLGEGLSVALRQLELLEISGAQPPEAAGQRNAPVKDAILETMDRLRAVTSDLRTEPVTSLEKALTRYLESMVADADVRLRISGEERWATPAVIDQVFLVLREALRNAFTHAAPRLVKVAVDFSPEALRASVHDDGRGFVPRDAERRHPATVGLASMRERTALIGGTLTISSAPARGTYIELHVPLSGCANRPS